MARRSVVIDLEVRNKQARTALQGVESGFTDLRSIADDPIPVRFDADRARASLQGIESGVTSLRKSTQQASSVTRRSTQAMGQGFSRASTQVQGSTTAVSNLSRLIEDAPYGPRGVANNINPFINSFQRLQSQTGSTTTAMKTLLTSAFTGPGALLTISALVTSAITAIQMGLFDWGEEAKDTEDQMETLMETMDEWIDEQREMGGENIFDPLGQASTQQRLERVKELGNELQSLFDLRTQAQELKSQVQQTRVEFTRSGSIIERSLEQNKQEHNQLLMINKQIDKQEELFGDLSKVQRQNILDKIDDIEATEALNDAFLRLNPALQRQLGLNKALRPVLRDIEIGINGAGEELNSLIEDWEQEAETIRDNIEAGKFQGDQLEEKKNILQALTKALEKATSAQEGLTEAEKRAGEFRSEMFSLREGQQQFQQTGLGGTLSDPSAPIQQPDPFVQDPMDVNPFEPIPQSPVDKELERLEQLINEWEEYERSTEEAGNSGEQSLIATTTAANMLSNALAQAVIRGEELGGVLKGLAAQLASKAFMQILMSLLSFGGGGIGAGTAGFVTSLFDDSTEGGIDWTLGLMEGFSHGTDAGFPGMGRVGERGEELLVAPPMSSIITNENVEKIDRMRQEAKNGATMSAAGVDTGAIAEAVREGIEVADIKAPVEISRMKRELTVFDELQNRIGN